MTKKAASLHAYGCGVWHTMHHTLGDGTVVSWRERWLVTHSPPHAARQQLRRRLAKAEQVLGKLRPRPNGGNAIIFLVF